MLTDGEATESTDELTHGETQCGAIQEIPGPLARPLAQNKRCGDQRGDDATTELKSAIPYSERLQRIGELLKVGGDEQQACTNESNDDQNHCDFLSLRSGNTEALVTSCGDVDTEDDAQCDEEPEASDGQWADRKGRKSPVGDSGDDDSGVHMVRLDEVSVGRYNAGLPPHRREPPRRDLHNPATWSCRKGSRSLGCTCRRPFVCD